jgi:hypothetical protein
VTRRQGFLGIGLAVGVAALVLGLTGVVRPATSYPDPWWLVPVGIVFALAAVAVVWGFSRVYRLNSLTVYLVFEIVVLSIPATLVLALPTRRGWVQVPGAVHLLAAALLGGAGLGLAFAAGRRIGRAPEEIRHEIEVQLRTHATWNRYPPFFEERPATYQAYCTCGWFGREFSIDDPDSEEQAFAEARRHGPDVHPEVQS